MRSDVEMGRYAATSPGGKRAALLAALVMACGALADCAATAPSHPASSRPASSPLPDSVRAELLDLRRRHDFFRLRDRIADLAEPAGPWGLLLRAEVVSAFGDEAASDSLLDRLAARYGSHPDSVTFTALGLRYRNDVRLYHFADALSDADALRASPLSDSATLSELGIRSDLPFLRALRDAPAQTVEVRADTVLPLWNDEVPVTIDGEYRHYAFDSGANFSALIRSEARKLGLEIQPTGGKIGSSTDLDVAADVAVANRVEVGGTILRHVVFLVLPDSALTFPGGIQIRGLLGFPVLRALGAVGFRRDGTLRVGPRRVAAHPYTMALEEYTLFAPVVVAGDTVSCHLDTGSGTTDFYQSFYRTHRRWVDSAGTPDSVETGGAGGMRRFRVVRVPNATLLVAGRHVRLKRLNVYTSPVRPRSRDACLLGRDALGQFDEYVLDFEHMALELGG